MSDVKQLQFGQRLRRIEENHRRLANGYVTSIKADGLIVAKPRQSGSILPWRGLFLAFAVMLLFKGFLFARLGPEAYEQRIAQSASGSAAEQMGAYAMRADPVTVALGQFFSGAGQ